MHLLRRTSGPLQHSGTPATAESSELGATLELPVAEPPQGLPQRTDEPNGGTGISGWCARIASSPWFQYGILAVIFANAIVIGAATYPGVIASHSDAINRLDRVFLSIFVVELVIRIASYGRHPQRFFTRGWNIFDFVIVAAMFVPGLSSNLVALRILRVLRVVRIVEKIDDLRVIVKGLLRSLAPLAGVGSLVLILTYIYAVIGNALFGEELPKEWGTLGSAMLSCFQILTLDNWDDLFFPAQDVSALAVPFFLSFILIATFVVLNIVIAIVVSSVDGARHSELAEDAAKVTESLAAEAPELAERIHAVRQALDGLEAQLSDPPASTGPASNPSGSDDS